jgi:hypothetical protein
MPYRAIIVFRPTLPRTALFLVPAEVLANHNGVTLRRIPKEDLMPIAMLTFRNFQSHQETVLQLDRFHFN